MDNYELLNSKIENLKERMDKMEVKAEKTDNELDNLKMSNAEIKVKLTNLELGVEQIKNMVTESTKENQKVTMKLIDTINNNSEAKHEIKLTDRKELWAVISLIVGGILAYLGMK